MNKKIIVSIIVLVIACGGSFYGGMKYSQSKSATDRQARFQQLGGQQGSAFAGAIGTNRGQRMSGGFISGEIISKDNESITVKLQDGGSKIIFFSTGTKISKNADGSLDDIKIGTSISANGTANQDGSVSAQTIQIRPTIPQPTK